MVTVTKTIINYIHKANSTDKQKIAQKVQKEPKIAQIALLTTSTVIKQHRYSIHIKTAVYTPINGVVQRVIHQKQQKSLKVILLSNTLKCG